MFQLLLTPRGGRGGMEGVIFLNSHGFSTERGGDLAVDERGQGAFKEGTRAAVFSRERVLVYSSPGP